MARYFFNVVEGDSTTLIKDCEGLLFDDLSEVKKEAVGWAQDFARHNFYKSIQSWKVVVTDDHGEVVMTAPLSEARVCKLTLAWLELDRRISQVKSRFGSQVFVWLLAAAILGVVMETRGKETPRTEMGGNYELASVSTEILILAIRFDPNASIVEITDFLRTYDASLIDGPGPNGFYKIRIQITTLSKKEKEALIGRIAKGRIVEFAAVKQ